MYDASLRHNRQFCKAPEYHKNIILDRKIYRELSREDCLISNNINPISKIKATLTFSLLRQAFRSRLEACAGPSLRSNFDLFSAMIMWSINWITVTSELMKTSGRRGFVVCRQPSALSQLWTTLSDFKQVSSISSAHMLMVRWNLPPFKRRLFPRPC